MNERNQIYKKKINLKFEKVRDDVLENSIYDLQNDFNIKPNFDVYYYKVENKYKVDKKAFLSSELKNKDKYGYVEVNEDNGKYYVEMMYNYSKIEFYTTEENMPIIISNCLTIVDSIKYNHNLIKIELDNATKDGRELKYELDKPKDSESTFSQYLQEDVEEEVKDVVLPDIE